MTFWIYNQGMEVSVDCIGLQEVQASISLENLLAIKFTDQGLVRAPLLNPRNGWLENT